MKKAFIVLASGFELIEALTPVDILKRCGIDVTTFSIEDSLEVESSHGVVEKADKMFDAKEALHGDIFILPGGYPGYENISNHSGVMKLAKRYLEDKRYIGAICGAPYALDKYGLINGRKVNCHFSVKGDLKGAIIVDKPVVVDENLITASGAGRSLEFALTIGRILTSKENVEQVKKGLTLS